MDLPDLTILADYAFILNFFTIFISLVAVLLWIKLVGRISISNRHDDGWTFIFGSVLLVLILNLSTVIMTSTSNYFFIDPTRLEFIDTFSRILMTVSMAIGAFLLNRSLKATGDTKFAFTAVVPVAEVSSVSKPMYEIKPGNTYLIKETERSSVRGVDLFVDSVTHGVLGFCITRIYPPKMREEYNLLKTPILWLTQEKGFKDSIPPGDLTELSHITKDFIANGGDTIVLLDGIEYLILHNSFEDILRLIDGIEDVVARNKARLILTLDPTTLTEQQVHLIGRNLKEFKVK